MNRCSWCQGDEEMEKYHDTEWGVPVHDDLKLFEFILLDSFQAGLSWKTILHKRQNFKKAFANFDPEQISRFDEEKINQLLNDVGIIRNKLKIKSTITNAQTFLKIQKEFGTFDKYIWQFVNYKTIKNSWADSSQIPVKTKESDSMSKDLIKHGFKFVGSTICYAFLQAAGMVNDHTIECFRYSTV